MITGSCCLFAREGTEERQKFCAIVFVKARLSCVDPCLSVCVSDLLCYLFVERAYVWVVRNSRADGVSLADKGLGTVR